MTETTACTRRPGATWASCHCPGCMIRERRTRKTMRCGAYTPPDANAARARLAEAVDHGWSPSAIVSATGVNLDTISKAHLAYRQGAQPTAFAHNTIRALLAPWSTPTTGYFDVTGTRRRLQALAVTGWGASAVARAVGVHPNTIMQARGSAGRRGKPTTSIFAPTALAIANAYETMVDQAPPPGGDAAVRALARGAGWHGSDSWPGSSIDDPNAAPHGMADEIAVARRIAGDRTITLSPADVAHGIDVLAARGWGSGIIATTLGCSERPARLAVNAARAAGVAAVVVDQKDGVAA